MNQLHWQNNNYEALMRAGGCCQLLVLKAEAMNKNCKSIATSTSHSLIDTDQVLKTRSNESNQSK